jgi:uncharacterized cupin superfamily protein
LWRLRRLSSKPLCFCTVVGKGWCASHERHLHRNCDEFFIVLRGHGHIITDHGLEASNEGDVVYSPHGCWHGFNNSSDQDVVLVWGWMGAGSIEASGYEVPNEHSDRR